MMVELNEVTKRYGDCVALDAVSLSMSAGRTYGLWGRNGAGKTTLLRIASGVLEPDDGLVRVLGKDPQTQWTVRRRMGIVEDGDGYFPELTAEEHLWWVGRLRGLDDAECRRQIERLVEVLYLKDRADDLIGSLSHGMRRKVGVASAFVAAPPVVLIDEPTTGLDVDSLDALGELLRQHARAGGTAVLASHDTGFIRAVCTDVIVLDAGRLAGDRLPER